METAGEGGKRVREGWKGMGRGGGKWREGQEGVKGCEGRRWGDGGVLVGRSSRAHWNSCPGDLPLYQ